MLVIGAVSVSVLNQWTWNLAGLITLLGWGSLLKGALGILLPDFSNRIIQKVKLPPVVLYISGIVLLLIGCYLLFVGLGFFLFIRGNQLA